MSEDNKILKNVNKLLAMQEFKDSIESLKEQVSGYTEYHKKIFKEMQDKGYTERQAFQFASDVTMKLMFFIPRSTTKDDES